MYEMLDALPLDALPSQVLSSRWVQALFSLTSAGGWTLYLVLKLERREVVKTKQITE